MMPTYAVVGYSGSGKTHLMERLVKELKARGKRVAVWKHDAHEFEIDHEGKDSYRITKAGADMTILSSGTKTVIMENRPTQRCTVLDYIHDVDLILTEGYRHGVCKKIGINRTASGNELSIPPEECMAIMSDVTMNVATPVYDINDVKALANHILDDATVAD